MLLRDQVRQERELNFGKCLGSNQDKNSSKGEVKTRTPLEWIEKRMEAENWQLSKYGQVF